MEFRKMVTITLYARQKKRHRCIEQTFGLCGRRRVWDDMREQHWNMYIIKCETDHQSRLDALGWPRGMGWGGRWEAGSGWGTHVNPWLIHVNVWQKPQQYFKVISLQLIKINEKKKKVDSSLEPSDERLTLTFSCRILDREPSYMACRPLTYWNWDIKN